MYKIVWHLIHSQKTALMWFTVFQRDRSRTCLAEDKHWRLMETVSLAQSKMNEKYYKHLALSLFTVTHVETEKGTTKIITGLLANMIKDVHNTALKLLIFGRTMLIVASCFHSKHILGLWIGYTQIKLICLHLTVIETENYSPNCLNVPLNCTNSW